MSTQTLLVAAITALSATAGHATELLVPAYFYPSFDPAQSQWDEMQAALATGAHITAIMNVNNGPGTALNSDYAAAVQSFRAAGGKVLGYVYTCYGNNNCQSGLPATRSVSDVVSDANLYQQWYGVDGIFLDEMSNTSTALPFYASVAQSLRASQPGWKIVGNAGTTIDASYLSVADTLVTREDGSGSYSGYAPAAWASTQPANRQAHLLYNITGADAMRSLLAQAVARNVGYVYITDDRYTPGSSTEPNPWDTLPSYWSQEAAAVSSVPEPSTSLMCALGAVTVISLVRRRLTRATN
jgi:hypothetical protein